MPKKTGGGGRNQSYNSSNGRYGGGGGCLVFIGIFTVVSTAIGGAIVYIV